MNEDELIVFEIDEELSEEILQTFHTFNSSSTSLDQLKIFKDISKLIITHEFIPRALLEKIFTLKVKHPIKNAIVNAFKQISDENAVKIICEEVERKIVKLDGSTLDDKCQFVTTLNEASQSFKLIFQAIGKKPEAIINFLLSMLILFHDGLKTELSPTERNKIVNRLHATIQVILSCIKNCIDRSENFTIHSQYKKIAEICMEILIRDDIFMDTKNVCGLLIVMRNNLINESSHLGIMRDGNENCIKRLCLMSGSVLLEKMDERTSEEFCEILEKIHEKNSVDNLSVSAVSRLFVLISKKLQDIQSTGNESTKIIINFAFSNIEHSVDIVKHNAKTSLKNILEIKEEKISKTVFDKTSSLSSIAVKAIVIQNISSALPIRTILTSLPTIQRELLASLHKHRENIFTCYEALSNRYYDEVQSFEEWHGKMIQPIIAEMNKNHDGKDDLKLLLSSCIKKDVKAIENILKNRDKYDISFILSCLNAAKKASLLNAEQSSQDTWRGVIKYDEIKDCMSNFDDNIRFSAFQLIAESKRATEELSEKELECIFYFYKMSINIQNPTIRQSIVSMTKKLFERLQMVIQVNRRKRDDEKLKENFQTLLKFQEFCIDNLIDGANFSRRMLSLKILSSVLEVFQKHFESETHVLWNEEKFNAILIIFYDNFETNKESALEIMSFIPRDIIIKFSRLTLVYLERLLTSIKPSDVCSSAFLLQFSIKFSIFDLSSESEILQTSYGMLNWCESLLIKALEIARKSIIISGGSYTLYGPMLCIRYITNKLNFNEIKSCQKWRELFSRLIKICRELSEVVAPIVNNSSPEGIFPDEESSDDAETLKIISNTTPQMVLINAWRSIKEVSLFLGDISLRGADKILSSSEMLQIADLFIILMTKTKHRGAFEQAFNGFSQFCVALRLSLDLELRNLPEKILQNLIASISGDNEDDENNLGLEMKNLCATRRSAGLPFILHSLISSEIKIARCNNFHFVMKNLLRYARFGSQLETRIHSLNILRALFRCKELNEVIMQYVSDAIQCSLLAYDAESWTERNSSTLLFSALMIRVFGPQRTKNNEELSIRNKMSGKLFFIRFPELHSFISKLLREAAEKVQEQKKNVKLHPLLLLLNRLYSSEENFIKLTEFLPIIASCSACVELQTRILCAKFIANNMPPKSVTMAILNDIKNCRDDCYLTGNAKHGKLLGILYLCRRREHVDEGESLKILNEVFEMVEKFRGRIMCLDVLLEIIVELLMTSSDHNLMDKVDKCLKFVNDEDLRATPLIQKKIVAMNLVKIKFDGTFDWLLNLSCSHFYELQEKLNCILLILDYDYALKVMDDYELSEIICELAKNIPCDKIKENSELKKIIKELVKSEDVCVAVRSYEILSYLRYEKGECKAEEIKEILECLLSKPDDLGKAMMKNLTRCLSNECVEHANGIDWSFLDQAMDASYLFKLSTLDIISIHLENISSITSTTFYMAKALLNLLMDDDDEVRFKASKVVSTIANKDQFYIASRAHEIFLKYLEEKCDKNDFMALIICIAREDMEDYSREENDDEFQVFERNETNVFKEGFLINQLCMSILRAHKKDVEKLKIVSACRVIVGKLLTEIEIENILKLN